MQTVATVLMLLAMTTTLVVLATGIVAMMRGGAFNAKWSNRLMRYRLLSQGVALAMFALALWLSGAAG